MTVPECKHTHTHTHTHTHLHTHNTHKHTHTSTHTHTQHPQTHTYVHTQHPHTHCSCQVVDNERTLNDLLDLFTLDTLNNIVAWLSTYWYIPVGVIVGIAILIILLQVTYRRRKPIKRRFSQARHSLRHRGGAQIGGGAPGGGERDNRPPPQRNISPSKSLYIIIYIPHVTMTTRLIGEALTRLSHFFPTADRAVIQSVVDSARSESKAVKKLLKNGYPMRRVPIPRA